MDAFGTGVYCAFDIASQIQIVTTHFGSDQKCVLNWKDTRRDLNEINSCAFSRRGAKYHTFDFRVKEANTRCGTMVKIHVKSDQMDFLEEANILENLDDVHTFVTYPVIVQYIDDEPETTQIFSNVAHGVAAGKNFCRVNQQRPVWLRNPKEVPFVDYLSLCRGISDEIEDTLTFKHLVFQVDSMEIRAVLFLPTIFFGDVNEERNHVRIYVDDLYVTNHNDRIFPRWLFFINGVIHFESFLLLKDPAKAAAIHARVVEECLNLFKELFKKGGKRFLVNNFYSAKLHEALLDPETTMTERHQIEMILVSFLGRADTQDTPLAPSLSNPKLRAPLSLQVLLECALTGIIIMRGDGTILLANNQTLSIFGYNKIEDFVGKRFDALLEKSEHRVTCVSANSSPSALKAFSVVGFDREFVARNRQGTFSLEVSLNPLLSSEGTVVLASVRDLNDKKIREESFRRIVEAAPNGMVMINSKGIIVLVNMQMEKMFGYDRDELIGKRIEELIPERFRERHPSLRSGFFTQPTVRSMGSGRELFGRRKDGSEFPIEIGLNPIYNFNFVQDNQESTVVLASLSDITERKNQEESFRQVVESAPNGMAMINSEGKIILVNAQMEKMFGYDRNELMNQKIEVLLPQRFREKHPCQRTGFFHCPSVRSMGAGRELFGRRKDGSEFPVEIGLNPISNYADEGTVVLASLSDITERQSQEESFRRIVEAAPNGMVMLTDKGRIVLVNQQMEKMFGYDRDELVGKEIEAFIPDCLSPSALESVSRNSGGCEMGPTRELTGKKKDGSLFAVEIGLNPISNYNGQGMVILGAVSNITERKNQEENFRRIVEAAPNGMVMINPKGDIILVNAQMEKMFGYNRNELVGQKIEMLIPPRLRDVHMRLRTGFCDNPSTRTMIVGRDLFGRRKDGSEFPVEIGLNTINGVNDEGMVLASLSDLTERKNEEESFKRIVEAAPNGMVMINASGRIIIVNAQMEKMFGYNRDELIGQPLECLLPERYRGNHPANVNSFLLNPCVRNIGYASGRDLFGRRKDGSEFPVEIGLNPIREPVHAITSEGRQGVSGKKPEVDRTMLVLAAIVDITERKKLEEKFRKVVESAPNGVIVLDPIGKIKLVNTHTERIFGYARAELFEKDLTLIIPNVPPPGQEQNSSLTHFLLGDPDCLTIKPSDNKIRNYIYGVRKNGVNFPLDIGISNAKNSDDEEHMVIISVMDVTERKRLEEEYRSVLQRERDAAEREAQSRSSLLARMSHEIRTPLTGVLGCLELLNSMEEEVGTNKIAKDLINTGLCCSNALLSVINDILNISKLEAGVSEPTQASVTKIFRPHVVVDEVSTILSAVLYEKGLSWKAFISPTVRPFLIGYPVRIRQILLNLAANAIKFTDRGSIIVLVDCYSSSLAELHEQGVDIFHERIFSRLPHPRSPLVSPASVRRAREREGKSVGAWASSPSLSSRSSATHGTPAGLDIVCSEPIYLCFSVSDNGIGMKPGVQTQLFQPFYQADDSTTRKYGGTGLGLAISKQLVELMGGSIFVHSELGVGSHFLFDIAVYVPREKSCSGDGENNEKPLSPTVERRNHMHRQPDSVSILVAEDNSLSQKVVMAMLRKLGYTKVTLANNGEEVIHHFETPGNSYDLILMDCEMPIVDGFKATQTIREKNVTVPIVAMTANAMVGDYEYCMSHGMDDYLAKPVRLNELALCLDKWT
eukprot:TRINITY_DN1438_c0_g1_i2.p1 TRINITY_DN1438_c0_g1~~TRINITY_DN1438_c0_g1_i2.p1  ORF type:complete len:1824 (+),score=303.29 TRINITY_DN1438_c0_g1_i2:370-5472(+)